MAPMLEFSGDLVGRPSLSKATAALLDHLRSRATQRKPQLLADDEGDFLYLILTLHRIPAASRLNPHLLPLPHPLFPSSADDDAAPSLCLILDDRPKSSSSSPPADAVLDRARSLSLPIAEAITLSSLRSDYRPFEARRKLCDSHDIFLSDRRILPLLPRHLGKHFFRKKKIPLAIDLSRPGWPEQVRRCLSSSPLYLRSGTCCAVRIGRVAMNQEAIVDNAMAVLKEAMDLVPQKWANLRSVHLKAVDSIALPVYQALPQTGLKISILPRAQKDEDGEVVDAAEEKPKGSKKNIVDSKKKKPKKSLGRIHELLQQINEDDAEMQVEGEESAELKDDSTVMHIEDEEDEEEEEMQIKKRKKGDGKKQKLTEKRKNKKTKKNLSNEDDDEMAKEVPIAEDGEEKKKKKKKKEKNPKSKIVK